MFCNTILLKYHDCNPNVFTFVLEDFSDWRGVGQNVARDISKESQIFVSFIKKIELPCVKEVVFI